MTPNPTEGKLTEAPKVKLKFRVDPDYLRDKTEVVDAVRITFTDPEKVFVLGLLGESGRTMVLDGAIFEFERQQAEWMISQGIAKLALLSLTQADRLSLLENLTEAVTLIEDAMRQLWWITSGGATEPTAFAITAEEKLVKALESLKAPAVTTGELYTREQLEDAMVLAIRSWTTYGSVNYIHLIDGIKPQAPAPLSSEAVGLREALSKIYDARMDENGYFRNPDGSGKIWWQIALEALLTPAPSEKTVHREVVHKKDCKALQYEDGDDCTCHALSGTGHAKKGEKP